MNKLKKLFINFYEKAWIRHQTRKEYKKYNKNEKIQNLLIDLTDEEKNRVDKFYLNNYGKKVDYDFHKVYKTFSKEFNEKCLIDTLYAPKFEHYMNIRSGFSEVIEDKNFIPIIAEVANIKMVETLVYNIRGIFLDSNRNIISKEKAIEIIEKENAIFVKPSINTCGGDGCKVFDKDSGYNELSASLINNIFNEYKTDFAIQKLVKNHESLKKIFPNALNTFRVITYIMDGKIKNSPGILRMGVGKARIDNASSGGIFVGINDDGTLLENAMNDFGNVLNIKSHPDTGVVFKDYKVEKYYKIIEAAKRFHSCVPQVGVINFDFSLDENGNPVLIEANICGGGGVEMIQWAHGKSPFGEDTAKILQWISVVEKMSKTEFMENDGYPKE